MNMRRLKLAALVTVSVLLWSCSRSVEVEPAEPAGKTQVDPHSWMHRVAVERDLSYGDDP